MGRKMPRITCFVGMVQRAFLEVTENFTRKKNNNKASFSNLNVFFFCIFNQLFGLVFYKRLWPRVHDLFRIERIRVEHTPGTEKREGSSHEQEFVRFGFDGLFFWEKAVESMDLLKMALQMTGLCESFVTHLTPKRWLASGVGAMMSRQIAG